jgi:two-component system sensor histidine kinase TtrS
MKRVLLLAVSVVLLLSAVVCHAAAGNGITVGFLVWTGPIDGKRQWAATGRYLEEKLHLPVKVLPLSHKKLLPAVAAGKVDFFTADPSMFIAAQAKYGAEAVAIMQSAVIGTEYNGAVIFTAAANSRINELIDLRDKKFGALRRWSFAGWQMAEREFKDAGLNAYTLFHTLRFFETPKALVRAVRSGTVQAGTLPTGLLEREIALGNGTMDEFKILAKKSHKDFPFAISTMLYPGFLLAKTSRVEPELAQQVATALKKLQPGDVPLVAAELNGWVDPLDYSLVEEVLGELKGMSSNGQRLSLR